MLTIDPQTNLIQGISFLPSPYCDERPAGMLINLLVIHGISLPPGQFGGEAIAALFLGKLNPNAHPYFQTVAHLKVSAHLLIRRDGTLIQFVPLHQRAWHAGESCFAHQTHCNDFSLGIELEGTDTEPYNAVQYEQLAEVVKAIQQRYPAITRERIVGHSDIAPGRKTDPGPFFDWHTLFKLLT